MRIRRVALLAGIGSAAVALTLGVTLAGGGDGATADAAALTTYAATTGGSESGDQTDLRSQIGDLMTDQAFRDDVRALRDTQQAAMDEWWDTYADDRDSDAAGEARDKLREEQRTEMNALLAKYGVDTSAMEQTREAAQQAREKIGELMSDDGFRDDVNALRDAQQAAMDAWWDKYGEDPTSSEAREAMQALREDARADMEALLEKYDVDLPGGLGGRLFGGRGGGLMGGGLGGGDLDGGGHGGGLMGGGPDRDTQESAATLSL